MSKSVGNTIEIFAPEEEIRRQIMSMVTDPQRIYRTQPGRPEICNVCQLHRYFTVEYEQVWEGERTARTGCVDTKKLLADHILDFFAEARARREELAERPWFVEEVLRNGAERLAPMARETLDEVRDRMGLGTPRG
jgi:tryptophanyl-tRNA synthetase